MGKIITFDYETRDEFIQEDLGAGWPYPVKENSLRFFPIGLGYQENSGSVYYESDINKAMSIILKADTIIGHHLPYDIGCLVWTMRNKFGESNKTIEEAFKDKLLIDTKLGFKWINNLLPSFHLTDLSKEFLKDDKLSGDLGELAAKAGLCKKPNIKKGITNMDILQEKFPWEIADYCCQDVSLTNRLADYLKNHLTKDQVVFLSDLTKSIVFSRLRGVPLDLASIKKVKAALSPKIRQLYKEMALMSKITDFNPNSHQHLKETLRRRGLQLPRTLKGIEDPDSMTTSQDILKELYPEDEFVKTLLSYRKYNGNLNNFAIKFEKWQKYMPETGNIGWVYPELNVMHAKTGRFSCTTPNLQQIPKRDEELTQYFRALFIPYEGEIFCSNDYNNQEGRIQAHFAVNQRVPGSHAIKTAFTENPQLDMHQLTADMMGVKRKLAKEIGLGLAYGLGITKMAVKLGVSESETKSLKELYNKTNPYINAIFQNYKSEAEKLGYVTTHKGRKVYVSKPKLMKQKDGSYREKSFWYRGLNYVTQGTAFDQTAEAMVQCYRKGIKVLFPVHDEICASVTNIEQGKELANIMQNAIPMSIPMIVECRTGSNWSKCG